MLRKKNATPKIGTFFSAFCTPVLLPWFHLKKIVLCFNVNMCRANELHIVVFKPQRFLYVHSFKSDQVKTKWLMQGISNHMDGKDGSSESLQGTIIRHPYPATYRKYVYPIVC